MRLTIVICLVALVSMSTVHARETGEAVRVGQRHDALVADRFDRRKF